MELGLNFPPRVFGRESEVVIAFRADMHALAISTTIRREQGERAHGIRTAPPYDSYALSLNSLEPNSSSRLSNNASCPGGVRGWT
jgi:hypothetical protein